MGNPLHDEANRLAHKGKDWEGVDRYVSNRYYAAAVQLRKAGQHIDKEGIDDVPAES